MVMADRPSIVHIIQTNPDFAQRLQDFSDRFSRSRPFEEMYSGDEAVQRYQQIVTRLTGSDYESIFQPAAERAVGRLRPDQRIALGEQLYRAVRPGVIGHPPRDSEDVAVLVREYEAEQPGGLVQFFSSQASRSARTRDWDSDPLAKWTLGGIAAEATDLSTGRSS
jgi:hypothetical protein